MPQVQDHWLDPLTCCSLACYHWVTDSPVNNSDKGACSNSIINSTTTKSISDMHKAVTVSWTVYLPEIYYLFYHRRCHCDKIIKPLNVRLVCCGSLPTVLLEKQLFELLKVTYAVERFILVTEVWLFQYKTWMFEITSCELKTRTHYLSSES